MLKWIDIQAIRTVERHKASLTFRRAAETINSDTRLISWL